MSTQPTFRPANGNLSATGSDSSADVLDLFGIFRRRKFSIFAGILLGLAIAAVYYVVALPLYEAELRVLLMFNDPGVAARGTTNNVDREGGQVAEQALATHMEVFTSRRIVKQAIENYELELVPSLHTIIADGKDPVKYIQDKIAVEMGGTDQDAKATIMCARFLDPSSEHCATVLNSLFAAYQDFLSKTYRTTGNEALELVQSEREKLKNELQEIRKRAKTFRENSPLQWNEDGPYNLHQARAMQIETELAELRRHNDATVARQKVIVDFLATKKGKEISDVERLSLLSAADTERLKLFYDVTKGDVHSETFQKEMPMLEAVASAQNRELLQLIMREKAMLENFGPDYHGIRVIRGKIEAVKEHLAANDPQVAARDVARMTPTDMLNAAVKLMAHDQKQNAMLKQQMEANLAKELAESRKMAAMVLEAESIQKELEQKQKHYDSMVARSGDVHLLRDFGTGFKAEVIAAAEPQTKVAWPRLPLVMLGGLVLGGFLGSGMAIFRDFSDSTFRGPDQLQDAMGVNIGAHIPFIKLRKRELQGDTVDPSLIMFHKPQSPEAESYRSLRTALLFDARKHGTRMIGFTSPTPGDGKSTTAANFACCLAQSGKSVLLIDGDLRRPRVGYLFGADRADGLSEVLLGSTELPDAIRDHEEVPNLSVLPAGSIPPNPAELLMLPEFEQLLSVVQEKFDYVFIDLPPLLAVSDPAIVAPLLDGLIFVMKVVKNGQKPAFKAKKMIDDLEARVICAVVNGSDQSGTPYGYADVTRHDYKYGYSYGDGYENREYFRKENKTTKKTGV